MSEAAPISEVRRRVVPDRQDASRARASEPAREAPRRRTLDEYEVLCLPRTPSAGAVALDRAVARSNRHRLEEVIELGRASAADGGAASSEDAGGWSDE